MGGLSATRVKTLAIRRGNSEGTGSYLTVA